MTRWDECLDRRCCGWTLGGRGALTGAAVDALLRSAVNARLFVRPAGKLR